MPQKRNPYALVVIRGARGHAARPRDRRARHPAHAVRAAPTTCSTPTARSRGAVELATRTLDLAAAVAESVHVRPRAGGARRARELALATDVAEAISLAPGSTTAPPTSSSATAARGATATLDATATLGARPRAVHADRGRALATRTVTGGAAPAPMDAMLRGTRATPRRQRAERACRHARERAQPPPRRACVSSRSAEAAGRACRSAARAAASPARSRPRR